MAAGWVDYLRKTWGWLSSVAAPVVTTVSTRYALDGTDNSRLALDGTDNGRLALDGTDNTRLTLEGE
jgi:hypothetical protein